MQEMLGRLESAFTPEELDEFTRLLLKAAKVFQSEGPVRQDVKKTSARKINIEE
ncbi:hypothetical protein D3C72_1078240 [compost metagenome]